MKNICDGNASRSEVVFESLNKYREVYVRTNSRMDILKTVFPCTFHSNSKELIIHN